MELSINLEKLEKIKIDTQIYTQKLKKKILYFKLSYFKFARNLQNTQTQTQNLNTQKIENPNPDLNLWVLLGAYV